MNIVHMRIEPTHIFIDGKNKMKLASPGLQEIHTKSSDVWALGCLLFEMATLHPLIEGKRQKLPVRFSERFDEIIDLCLAKDTTIDKVLHLLR